MDYNLTFAISAAGMTAERTRVDVAALNLANANTIGNTDDAVYRPLRVVTRPLGLATPFASLVGGSMRFAQGIAFPAASIEPTGNAPRKIYEPGHPMADKRGFLNYPGVDPAAEMVSLMSATRAYEANVAAMNATRALALKALEIGGPGR